MTDIRVLVVGEALVDVVETSDGLVAEHVGGSPANVAFGIAALGHDVELATWIGPDERGNHVAQRCAAAGVRLAPGSRGAARTSVAHARIDRAGKASYRFDITWTPPPLPASPDHVHTGSIAAALDPGGRGVVRLIRSLRERATVSYDPNVRPALLPSPEQARVRAEKLVGLADVVKASDEDLEWLYPGVRADDVLRRWGSAGPQLCVLTRGAGGAAYVVRSGETTAVAAPPAHVVDTVGAGDSFMAGLVSGLADAGYLGGPGARARLQQADSTDVRAAVDRALRAAAVTVQHAGAYAPPRAELVGAGHRTRGLAATRQPGVREGGTMAQSPGRGESPAQAWAALAAGNQRFVAGRPEHPNQDVEARAFLASGQTPRAAFFGCADSRVAAEIIFDQGLGDLFVVRTAGHVVGTGVLGSLEFAVGALGIPLIVVLGHDSCGAVRATIDALNSGEVPSGFLRDVVERVLPSVLSARRQGTLETDAVEAEHVRHTAQLIADRSAAIGRQVADGRLAVVGATYDLREGRAVVVTALGLDAQDPA